MVHNFTTTICVKDRAAWHYGGPCTICGEPGIVMGTRYRAPKKTNIKAWKRIAKGDYLWERPKTFSLPTNPYSEEWRVAWLEAWRRRDKKYKRSLLNV